VGEEHQPAADGRDAGGVNANQRAEADMSAELGRQLLDPGYTGRRVPVMEHLWGLSRAQLVHFSGIDPVRERSRVNECFRRVAEHFECDLSWGGGLPDSGASIYDWDDPAFTRKNHKGEDLVQWGIFATVHQEDGRHFTHIPKPASIDEALELRPLELFPETVEQYRERFQAQWRQMRTSAGEVVWPLPHHYTTCFHAALAIFGFEMLCEVGLADEGRFHRLMEQFAEVSWRITSAWSQVEGVEGFICHDDLVMTSGPIFSPAWYRRHIFCHYPEIFRPLKQRGIQVIFTSDGDCTAFVDDIFAAGADGLNFEYLVDLAMLVGRYPTKILIGNISSVTIAEGPLEAIEREVTRTMQIGARAPRFVVNIGGQLVHTMPIEHLEFYLNLRKKLAREVRAAERKPCSAS
jgi:hypothetical protein